MFCVHVTVVKSTEKNSKSSKRLYRSLQNCLPRKEPSASSTVTCNGFNEAIEQNSPVCCALVRSDPRHASLSTVHQVKAKCKEAGDWAELPCPCHVHMLQENKEQSPVAKRSEAGQPGYVAFFSASSAWNQSSERFKQHGRARHS